MGERELDWAGSRQGQVANSREHGNSLSVFIKWGDFLEYKGIISFWTRTCCMELLYVYCNENSRIPFCPEIAKYCASLCLFNDTLHIVDIFSMAQQPPVGQGLRIIQASQSHSDTPHSAGLLWMSDQPVAKTCIWQHTKFLRADVYGPGKIQHRNPRKLGAAYHALDNAANGIGSFRLFTSNDRMTNASEELWKETASTWEDDNVRCKPSTDTRLEPATSRTRNWPLSYGVPVRERYGSTLLPATREQHDQNCTQSH